MPAFIHPDHLTALGVAGGMLVFAGFALSNLLPAFLWLAAAGLVLNWVGDSLDGSLARYRCSERPRFGYFLDHMTDSFSMSLIGIGAGLSPFLSMSACLLVLIGYLLLTVLSVLEARVRGILRISFGKIGPTEFRIFLLLLVGVLYWHPQAVFEVLERNVNVYDAILYVTAAALTIVCLSSALRVGQELMKEDPELP
ncbi:CDP-alcohol phosphatidyltransferase family protein [Aestuariivirga sp.]|jgi:phosphatidylglycerophosphate synthase|uniref:CDP-alcohol phosphatidyltransferase family protein n=1 Tax=Aestuariivirga sp. TaxID=2650926 RepID=UPI0037830417